MKISNLETTTVAELVSENIKTAHVFKKFGIDFCCGGGIAISEACANQGVSLDIVSDELKKIDEVVDKAHDYQSWSIDYLIMHIENIHHSYVREALPMLAQYAEKVARVHGHHYSELLKIKDLVEELATDLMSHMLREEQVLFPAIRRIVLQKSNEISPSSSHIQMESPIKVMMLEHEHAGNILKELSELTQGYEAPDGACNTYRAFYSKLEEFERDLHQHVHLENNILFPKIIQMN